MQHQFIYAIVSEVDGRVYVGMSDDPERRLTEHNQGKTRSTKGFKPWKLFFKRKANDRKEARELEKYYKSGSGKEKLKVILKQNGLVVQRIPACRCAGWRDGRQGIEVY